MAPMRWSCVMFALQFLVAQAAQAQQSPNNNCSAISSMSQQSSKDPCSNTTAYSELGDCARFMAGNITTPSAECCASAHNIWALFPACFCKVTYFSKFPGDGPALSRARPTLCNITDDLCSLCPGALLPFQSGNVNIAPCYENGNCCGEGCYFHYIQGTTFKVPEIATLVVGSCSIVRGLNGSSTVTISDNTGGHKREINTASVVTISVIVTLAIVGCAWLLYFCKKKAPWKPKSSPSKNYVPQFNNV